jgi:hypothetical protein
LGKLWQERKWEDRKSKEGRPRLRQQSLLRHSKKTAGPEPAEQQKGTFPCNPDINARRFGGTTPGNSSHLPHFFAYQGARTLNEVGRGSRIGVARARSISARNAWAASELNRESSTFPSAANPRRAVARPVVIGFVG